MAFTSRSADARTILTGVTTWRDAAGDLLLGSRCAGCSSPGRRLCQACAGALVARPRVAWPDPVPGPLLQPAAVTPFCGGTYEGSLRELVVAYKDHARYGLRRPLARMLADVIGLLTEQLPAGPERLLLVPIPSAPAAVRRRGHDSLLSLARLTAALLRRRGRDVTVGALLHQTRAVLDSAGLSAVERSRNLAGALTVRAARVHAGVHGRVVVVDDVITTGASAAEAVRALRGAGLTPLAVAVVAATPRRFATPVAAGDPAPRT